MNAILQFLNTWEYLIKIITVVAIFICSTILIVKEVKWLIDAIFITLDARSEKDLAKNQFQNFQIQNFQNAKNANNLNPNIPTDYNKHLDSLCEIFEENIKKSNDIIGSSKRIICKICVELAIFSIVTFSCGAGLISFFLAGN